MSNVGFFCVSCACANGSLFFCPVDARSLLYSVRYVRGVVRGVGSGGCAWYGLVRWFSVLLRLVASLFLHVCSLSWLYSLNRLRVCPSCAFPLCSIGKVVV